MKSLKRMLAVAVVALATGLPLSTAHAQSAPYCGIRWGSQPKQVSAVSTSVDLTNVRAGQHACFDRLVLDGASFAQVRYVSQVIEDGSGRVVPLRGAARLQILTNRSDDVQTGKLTYNPANPSELVNVARWRTFRQAVFAGDFEGQTTLGLGVRARLPFRVFVLAAPGQPTRTVIDVAHRW